MINEYDISVVIVNYNVKDFLFQCLKSVQEASSNLKVQTIVVDNNSSDGSCEFLKPIFNDVLFIELNENLGFGRANNLGFNHVEGKYTLILNPDTIISNDTLDVMFDFMENHLETGISGCKVLNGDGTFQLACRRGFPTPWASFTKLFGLQKLFPKSKIFASYNQTFRDIDESYYIDAVIGAFMFIRSDLYKAINGFDSDFFMYGEDLDLCYRAQKAGYKVSYVHSTSIIHYKGESTKRSSINELRHFYEAMEIFAEKHFSNSLFFLLFLRLGIFFRSLIANINKNKSQIALLFADTIVINFSLILATKIRFNEFFNFPDWAYPTVFIVLTIVMLASMIGVGEYFEGKPAVRKSFLGLLITFFIVSSLTYFFKEYAFSRGILLMTIGFSIIASTIFRAIFVFSRKMIGEESQKRLAIIGINEKTEKIINQIISHESQKALVCGIFSVKSANLDKIFGIPVLGTVDRIKPIIEERKISEIIITDSEFGTKEMIKFLSEIPVGKVRFHFAGEYEELIASRVINEIAGTESEFLDYNLRKPRYIMLKRLTDIIISLILLVLIIPFSFMKFIRKSGVIRKFWTVFIGSHSLIGFHKKNDLNYEFGKPGIISLADLSITELLSKQAIDNLNKYYLKNYNISLDFEIIFKYLFKKSNF